jgi:hypothetical protein
MCVFTARHGRICDIDAVPHTDMLTLNSPPLTQHISIPRDLSQLSCEAFTAGIVEGVLDGLDVVSALTPMRHILACGRS